MKYTVIGILAASTSEHVEADSPEEAVANAAFDASTCWYCSKKIDTDGEITGVIVLDEDGTEVLSEKW